MTRSFHAQYAALFAMGLVLAAVIGIESRQAPSVSEAQFELQVEEGLGSFDRLPANWAMLHQR